MSKWKLAKTDEKIVKVLAAALRCHPLIALLLVNRGVVSVEVAQRFFNASAADLTSPFLLKDMDLAVRRIYDAIIGEEKIVIFGDYDADGVTATAVLIEFFHLAGVNAASYIPHRIREGYGLQPFHVKDDPVISQADLIITADCGIASHDAVDVARSSGIDIIITDHHIPSPELPTAAAVINPNRSDCSSGLGYLAGVGVAFYLVMALRKHLREQGWWSTRPEPNLKAFCDLVAIGTIADRVPLIGDNRILSKLGLSVINSGRRPGIRKLLKQSGISEFPVDSESVAFRLAPRLNAPGRIGHADKALMLLTAATERQADEMARTLNDMNLERREVENEILSEALAHLKERPDLINRSSIVLWSEGWHQGVLGIVSSRLVQKYQRPVVLLSVENGLGKGSCRSVPGIDILSALRICEKELITFGGHAMAAGMTIVSESIKRFGITFDRAVETVRQSEALVSAAWVDCLLAFSEITNDLMDQIDSLKPFGSGNPEPRFLARDVQVIDARKVGKDHLRMRLDQPHGQRNRPLDAIWFNFGKGSRPPEHIDTLVYRLSWNRWNGRKTLQLNIEVNPSD